MKYVHFIKAVFLAVLMSVLLAQPLLADERRNGHRPDSRHNITLGQAVKKARGRYDGRVLSAETMGAEDGSTYNIRILTNDGHVRRLRVDPSTGEYIKPRRR